MGRMTLSNGANTKRKGTVSVPKSAPAYKPPAQVFQQAGPTLRQGYTPQQWNAPPPVMQQPAILGPSAGFSPGGGAPGGSFAPPAPPRMSEADWLKGDAEFNAQQNEYNRALELFKTRINKKKGAFEDDYKESSRVTGLNKQQTMTGVGEDFAARGMAYSGLFDSARTDTENVFKRQLGNLELVRNRNKSQADDDLADYQQEIDLSRGNAKRNALARFANQQSLM